MQKTRQDPRSKTSHGEKYVLAEFKRAKTSLQEESSKIEFPKRCPVQLFFFVFED